MKCCLSFSGKTLPHHTSFDTHHSHRALGKHTAHIVQIARPGLSLLLGSALLRGTQIYPAERSQRANRQKDGVTAKVARLLTGDTPQDCNAMYTKRLDHKIMESSMLENPSKVIKVSMLVMEEPCTSEKALCQINSSW